MRCGLGEVTLQAVFHALGEFRIAAAGLTTRQYARLVQEWVASIGLDPAKFFAGQYHFPNVKGMRPPPPGTVLEPVGCPACQQLGYRGRTGIYEMLMVNDAVRRLALEKADAGSIRNVAVDGGMVSLRYDGARKVVLGMTTPEEVMLMTAESGD